MELLKNRTMQALAEKVIFRGTGLLLFLWSTRHLSKEEMGGYLVFFSLAFYITAIREGMVKNGFIRLAGTDRPAYEQASSLLGMIVTVILTILFLAGTGIYGVVTSGGSTLAVLAVILLMPASDCRMQYAVWQSHSREDFLTPLVLRIIERSSLILFLVVFSRFWSPLETLIFSQIAANIVGSLVSIRIVPLAMGTASSVVRTAIAELVNFGKYSLGTMVSSRLLRSSDLYLVSLICGPASAAIYGVASRSSDYVEVPLQAVGDRLYPKLVRTLEKGNQSLVKTVLSSLSLTTIITVPFAFCMILFPELTITLLAGETYRSAAPLIQIWGVFTLFKPLDRITGIALDALGIPEINMKKCTAAALVTVLAELAILLTNGNLGLVVWSICATQIVSILYAIFKIVQKVGMTESIPQLILKEPV